MTITKCPACNSEVFSQAIQEYLSNGECYKLYSCPVCDLQFWHPRITDPQYYCKKSVLTSNIGLQRLRLWHHPFFRYFSIHSGKLLDVGCEDGAFLAKIQKIGFEVYGTDFDHFAINAGQKRRGLTNLYSKSLRDFFLQSGKKFDVITFFEVLEHQDNPQIFLEDIKNLLTKNGWIAGSVPNRDRFIIKREYQDFPPCHFLYFSEVSLRNFLERHGFSNIQIYSKSYRITDLAIYLENQLLSDIGNNLKKSIKKNTLGVSEAAANGISVENLPRVGINKYLFLKLLKFVRNAILFIPAWILSPILRPHLYFQAQLKDGY